MVNGALIRRSSNRFKVIMYAVIDSDGVTHKVFHGDDEFIYREACVYARKASENLKGRAFHVVKTKSIVYTEKPVEESQQEEKRIIVPTKRY